MPSGLKKKHTWSPTTKPTTSNSSEVNPPMLKDLGSLRDAAFGAGSGWGSGANTGGGGWGRAPGVRKSGAEIVRKHQSKNRLGFHIGQDHHRCGRRYDRG